MTTKDQVLSIKAAIANAKNQGNYIRRLHLSDKLRKMGYCLTMPLLIAYLGLHQIITVEHEHWQDIGIVQDTWRADTWQIDKITQKRKYISYIFSISNGKRLYMYEHRRDKYCYKCGKNGMWTEVWNQIPYDQEVEAVVLEWERIKSETDGG